LAGRADDGFAAVSAAVPRVASLELDPADVIAPVRRRTFGSFVEHMGRCVYGGLYEPGHPSADPAGFRRDVLELVRELGVSVVRYPGGNFVSGYRWEDGIGPVADRPRRRDLAWHSVETNEVGVDEFARWARLAGVEVMLAVNLGTRGVLEALDLHEYVNHPGGTALSELRRSNGSPEPYGVSMWCLGNELDGPWQIGHKTAAEYGRLAAETGRALRAAQPGIELVACGSSSSRMPTFGGWEATVLEHAYDVVDYISCHAYYDPADTDLGSFLASAADMDHFVASVVSTADSVGARLRSRKKIMLSFDEWNIWSLSAFQALPPPAGWAVAPRVIEDTYTVTDAVVLGSLLISLLRHSDRVSAACLAQLVNVIAPIRAEPGGPAWRQTTFHPFAATARLAAGEVLRPRLSAPLYQTARYGEVSTVDAVATWDAGTRSLAIFAVNRDVATPVELRVNLRAFGPVGPPAEAVALADEDILASNSEAEPDRVLLVPAEVRVDGETVTMVLPRVSWSAVRFRL
jgi:alpha-L-arabinofuranosidase